jgi:hypothetical protein
MELEGSVPCSQEPTIGHYPDSGEPSPHLPIFFLEELFDIHLLLGLPSGIFPLGFSIEIVCAIRVVCCQSPPPPTLFGCTKWRRKGACSWTCAGGGIKSIIPHMVGCDRCLIVHTTYAQGSIEQRNDETAELAFTGTLCAPLSVAVVPINTRGGTMNN